MKREKSGVEIICLILIGIIVFLALKWQQSEDNRINLLYELNDAKLIIEDLEKKNEELNSIISWYEDKT